MYQALTRDPAEVCGGNWYREYPTLENAASAQYFTFEVLGDVSREETHLVNNLKADEERMSISTSFRHPFAGEQYVAALGSLWKIERVNTVRTYKRGVVIPTVKTTLHLIRCASNPLNL